MIKEQAQYCKERPKSIHHSLNIENFSIIIFSYTNTLFQAGAYNINYVEFYAIVRALNH